MGRGWGRGDHKGGPCCALLLLRGGASIPLASVELIRYSAVALAHGCTDYSAATCPSCKGQ